MAATAYLRRGIVGIVAFPFLHRDTENYAMESWNLPGIIDWKGNSMWIHSQSDIQGLMFPNLAICEDDDFSSSAQCSYRKGSLNILESCKPTFFRLVSTFVDSVWAKKYVFISKKSMNFKWLLTWFNYQTVLLILMCDTILSPLSDVKLGYTCLN